MLLLLVPDEPSRLGDEERFALVLRAGAFLGRKWRDRYPIPPASSNKVRAVEHVPSTTKVGVTTPSEVEWEDWSLEVSHDTND